MASQRDSDASTQQEEGRISEESAAIHHDIEQGGGLADGSGVDGEEDDGGPPLPLQQQFDERSDHEIKLAAAAAGVGATTVGPNITTSSEIIANTRGIEEGDVDGPPPLPLQHLEGTASDRESKLSVSGEKDSDAAPQDAPASVAAAVAQSTIEQITDEEHADAFAAPIPYQQQFEDHDASQKGALKADQHDDNELDVAHDILQDDSAPIPLAQQRGIDDMNVDNNDGDAELRDAKLAAKLQMANESGGGEGEGGSDDDERKPPAITSAAAVTSAAALPPSNSDHLQQQQQQEEERGSTLLDTESATVTAAVEESTSSPPPSSPPQVQRSDSSGVPILEAYLVEDPEELPPGPVYDAETDAIYTAEATTILPWYKETRTKIFAAIVVVLLIVVSIVLGIVIPRLLVPPEKEIKPPTVCFQDRTELLNATNRYITSGCGEEKTKCAEGDVELYGWPIGEWCVENVTDMSNLFYNRETFDEDISQWDVSNVVDMSWMFYGAQSFAQNLSSWNVTNVKSMFRMFDGAISFNSDIGSWAISNETRTNSMFFRASSFNQDLCQWGDSFAYDSSNSIFLQSGCTYQESPRQSDRGPFCGSKCGELQPSTEPSISQSPSVSNKPSLRPSVNPPPTPRPTLPPTWLVTFDSTPGVTVEP
jgi:hypothetical protein